MSQPTPGDVHVNAPLTNISIAFMQNRGDFIADQVFSNIPVQKQSDVYYQYDRGFFMRDEMAIRAPGTETVGSGYEVSTSPYYCPVYGFHHDIPDQRRANADSVLNQDREAVELVTMKAMLKREIDWSTSYLTSGVWTTDITGVASSAGAGETIQWDAGVGGTDADPIADIRTGLLTVQESTGFRPNTMVLGPEVFDALIDQVDIVDRVKYGQTAPGIARADINSLKNLFGIERILIGQAVKNTASEGATNAFSFVTGKSCLLCYVAPSPGIMTPSAGYTFSWNGYLGASPSGNRIKRFRMENIASDRVEIESAFVHQLVSADLGYLFESIIS